MFHESVDAGQAARIWQRPNSELCPTFYPRLQAATNEPHISPDYIPAEAGLKGELQPVQIKWMLPNRRCAVSRPGCQFDRLGEVAPYRAADTCEYTGNRSICLCKGNRIIHRDVISERIGPRSVWRPAIKASLLPDDIAPLPVPDTVQLSIGTHCLLGRENLYREMGRNCCINIP